MAYDPKPVKAPRLTGFPLKLFVALVERGIGAPLRRVMLNNLGVPQFRAATLDESPSPWPVLPDAAGERVTDAPDLETIAAARAPDGGFPTETIGAFADAYRSGKLSPREVAERVLEATRKSNAADPPLRAIIAQQRSDVEAQAEASAERFANGKPLSILDGVPIAVKDEVEMVPYPTTVGTSFLGTTPASYDSTVVERLRAAGALLIGKANMTEIGIVVTGLNPHHGAVRNPYQPTRMTGGSSSGPAGAVAAGLCPAALGADGGGSIRVPAALSGIVGLKATFGRIPEFGAAPLCWSVAHLGPMASTARDTALLYYFLAGADERDPHSLRQPAPSLAGFTDPDLSDVRIGVYRRWFEHADPEVVELCDASLEQLTLAGAEVVGIDVPELEAIRLAHVITIASEMTASHRQYFAEHLGDYGYDVRLNFALVNALNSADYVNAQRMRTRACAVFENILSDVDVIATPASSTVAPIVPEDALTTGESNLELLDRIIRFAPVPNLTGLPAISFPAGYTPAGLPVGLQLIGRPWQEHLLLRMAQTAEHFVERRPPMVRFSLLEE